MMGIPPVMLGTLTPQSMSEQKKKEVADVALQTLVRFTDGAKFGKSGQVKVVEAKSIATEFPWNATEILRFMKASEEEKEEFVASSFQGAADLYRLVWAHMGKSPDAADRIFSRTAHTCCWCAPLDARDSLHGWRGPRALRSFLDMFDGTFPQTMVPSKKRPGSYMRLEEIIDNHAEVSKLKVDAHHPSPIFKERWDSIKSEWNSHNGDLRA